MRKSLGHAAAASLFALTTLVHSLPCVSLSPSSGGPPSSTAPSSPNDKPEPFPKAPDRDLVAHVCTPCHAPELVVAKQHTADEWDQIIGKMLDHGAQASEAEQDRILSYLVRFYGK